LSPLEVETMQIKTNVDLSFKTTMHIGGIADFFYIPESVSELQELIEMLDGKSIVYRIISGGSNLLINDKRHFDAVISMECLDQTLEQIDEKTFYIGASNRIQKVISFVNSKACGGFEELIGLPALFGGIVYMNAGIGGEESAQFCIGDFINRVRVLDRKNKSVCWLNKNECQFSHRRSIFQNDQYIIIGAELTLYEQDERTSKNRIEKRREYCKSHQEYAKGCFGSCFAKFSHSILRTFSRLHLSFGSIKQIPQNPNWLINCGNAKYRDVLVFILLSKFVHHLFRKKIELEIRIWR